MAVSSTEMYARRSVLLLSAVAAAVGLYWIGRSFMVDGQLRFGNPVDDVVPVAADGEPVADEAPYAVRAEVTRASGQSGVRVGDKCEFLVEYAHRQCHAQITCGDKLLYGGPSLGYFTCRQFEGERRDLLGTDPNTTSQDQDPAMKLDTRAGVLRVWDDPRGPMGEFSIDADVYRVQ